MSCGTQVKQMSSGSHVLLNPNRDGSRIFLSEVTDRTESFKSRKILHLGEGLI